MWLTQHKEVVSASDSGACHVKLAMGEAWFVQLESCYLKGLALGLVDGHCKAQTNRKLKPLETESKVTWGRYERNSWDHYFLPLGTTTEDCCHYDMRLQLLHHQSGSVAQSGSIKIPQ